MRVAVSIVLSWALWAGAGYVPISASLAARGERRPAFAARCIPSDCVASPSNTLSILGRRALSHGRIARLGATADVHHELLAQQPRMARGRLFPPEKLGELEVRDRDEWQEPDRIMDALGIADGARVADVGAGGGWFTVRLARRVGPNGRVYAEDIQHQMIESIQRRVLRENLRNVETKLGTATDPKLPGNLNAVLIVDTYPQLDDPVQILKHLAAALAPNGRLGIVDFKKDVFGPGPAMNERLEPEVIIRDAIRAGLRLHAHHKFLRYQYLLVFTR